MIITTRAVYEIATGQLLEWEGYEYSGPLELCGGGPSPEQTQAAAAQAGLSGVLAQLGNKQEARADEAYHAAKPFFQNRMDNGVDYLTQRAKNGLPYFQQATDYAGGLNAKAFAPARTALLQRIGSQSGLPSGYRDQALSDFENQRAQGYDNNLMGLVQAQDQAKQEALAGNEQARRFGAAGISQQQLLAQQGAQGAYGGAQQGYGSIVGANGLQRPGLAGLFGGVAGGAASSIPF